MNKKDLELAKGLKKLEEYFVINIANVEEDYDFINRDLKIAKKHKAFLKSLDFNKIKKEVLKNINKDIKKIKTALAKRKKYANRPNWRNFKEILQRKWR